jgi:GT2 family glycosyltransferase
MPLPPDVAFQLRRLRRVLSLPKRAYLTLRYHGARELAFRLATFPLRGTPLGRRLGLAPLMSDSAAPARRWYRSNARPVAVVIPTYGDTGVVANAVRSVRRTTDRRLVRIIVSDDGSPPEHQDALRRLADRFGVHLVLGDRQRGFAANCNRGLAATRSDEDVVLLNSDVVAHAGWLQALQYTAYEQGAGVVGGRLLYPDGTIQFAGGVRNPHHPGWFDHRFRGRRADLLEANVPQAVLTVTGACMYLTRATLDEVGTLDEDYEMAFEDADLCVRAWEAGHRVVYAPAAILTHHESKTRGMLQGPRELRSQTLFWSRWGDWFDRRDVRAGDGGLRIVYAAVGNVPSGQLNGLAARGHHPELWTVGEPSPEPDLQVPTRRFDDLPALIRALDELEAIKVATSWATADPVWEASVRRGIPVYLVDDVVIPQRRAGRALPSVLASYRPDFDYLALSESTAESLRKVATSVTTITSDEELERAFRELAAARAPRRRAAPSG